MEPDEDLPPADPAESLRLIEQERARAERNLTPDPRLFLWPWGLAWLIGFGVLFLRFGPDGRVFVDLPEWLPLALLAVLMIAAGLSSGILGARSSRDLHGPSSSQGAMYGITWSAAYTGVSVVLSQVTEFLPPAQQNLMWSGASVALAGALHMAGGAVFNNRPLFLLGAWIGAVNVIGVLIGPGWHALIVSIAGGGGMLVAGALAHRRLSR